MCACAEHIHMHVKLNSKFFCFPFFTSIRFRLEFVECLNLLCPIRFCFNNSILNKTKIWLQSALDITSHIINLFNFVCQFFFPLIFVV